MKVPPLTSGYLAAALLIFLLGCDREKGSQGNASPESADAPQAIPEDPPIEKELERRWQAYILASRQEIFNALHPIGKAGSAVLHQLEVKWKDGRRTNREEDILMIGVRFTVFWDGPITKDGYTKLFVVYDSEVGRITGTQVLATNGITNDQFAEGVGYAVGLGIAASMQGE